MTRRGTVIRHKILTSETVSQMISDEVVIWFGFLMCADDWGRLPDKPNELRMRMPAFNLIASQISLAIDKFESLGLIERYTARLPDSYRTVTVLQLTGWELHQKRLTSRDYPELPDRDGHLEKTTNPLALKKMEEKEKEEEKEKGRPVAGRSPDSEPDGKKTNSKPKEPKKKYGKYVQLTDTEYSKLCKDYGSMAINSKIEDINNYCGSHGKKYKDYAATIRAWLKKDNVKKIALGWQCLDCNYMGKGNKPERCPHCDYDSFKTGNLKPDWEKRNKELLSEISTNSTRSKDALSKVSNKMDMNKEQ